MHGDGGSFGKPQPRAAARAGRTVLSTVTTNDYPTILAARREMQSWRRLALEPSALRAPDNLTDPRSLGVDGRHLAATLYRIAHEKDRATGAADPDAVYARVAGRLSDLVGVGVETVSVELDPVREVFTLILEEKGGLRLPARALSEGTRVTDSGVPQRPATVEPRDAVPTDHGDFSSGPAPRAPAAAHCLTWYVTRSVARARVWNARLNPTTAGATSGVTPSLSTSIACTAKTYRWGRSPAGGAAPP